MQYQLSKRLVPHRCLSSSPGEHTIERLSPSYLLLLATLFLLLPLPFSLGLSFLSLSGSTHFAGDIKCDVGMYVDENHIVYTKPPRAHVYTRARLLCGVLGPGGRTAVPATLSRLRPLHMPLHTHIMDRPSVPLSPVAALSSGSLARFVSLARAAAVYTSGTSVGRRYTALPGAAASWTRVPCRSPLTSPPPPPPAPGLLYRQYI